jgi:multicomponent K+:H+ antiporter subunit G
MTTMPVWLDVTIALLIVIGALFALIGSYGLLKLADFFKRLHGPTKASTLGVGSVLIASMLYFSFSGGGVSVHELLITLFIFLTAPVSAHLLVKAAMHLAPGVRPPEPRRDSSTEPGGDSSR